MTESRVEALLGTFTSEVGRRARTLVLAPLRSAALIPVFAVLGAGVIYGGLAIAALFNESIPVLIPMVIAHLVLGTLAAVGFMMWRAWVDRRLGRWLYPRRWRGLLHKFVLESGIGLMELLPRLGADEGSLAELEERVGIEGAADPALILTDLARQMRR